MTVTVAPAIGFIRVSSKAQANGNDSLAAQEDAVRAHASARGLDLLAIYKEAGSAWMRPLDKRPELTGALIHARSTNAVLIVPRADRLTRRTQDLSSILDFGVTIEVCDQSAERVGHGQLEKLVRSAQEEGTNKSLAQKAQRSANRRRPSPATLEGQRRGREVLQARREDNIWRVRNFALQTPGFADTTRKRQVVILNEVGVLHLTSRSGPAGEPWTYNALKHLWPDIQSDIALQEDEPDGARARNGFVSRDPWSAPERRRVAHRGPFDRGSDLERHALLRS